MVDSTSKQKAINVLNSMKFDVEYCTEYGKGYNDGIDFALSLLVLLSEQPERKTGKWIMHSDFPDRLICSKCGATFDAWHWEAEQMHFCPQCGFKMGEERRTDGN